MKRRQTLMQLLALAILVVGLSAAASAQERGPTRKDVPQTVRTEFARAYPKAAIKAYFKEVDGGHFPGLAVPVESQLTRPDGSPREVVVYASDLPSAALSEFNYWEDPSSPGGRLVGTLNTGDNLDPPPENDPHVTFKVAVQRGVPYRCWIHMKVGAPKGVSLGNKLWVQFSDAVDKENKELFKPGTGSYLTAQGPVRQGWAWVGCDSGDAQSPALIQFRNGGEVTVRLQAGMEGVGFDQFLLSPAQFLDKQPSEAVVRK